MPASAFVSILLYPCLSRCTCHCVALHFHRFLPSLVVKGESCFAERIIVRAMAVVLFAVKAVAHQAGTSAIEDESIMVHKSESSMQNCISDRGCRPSDPVHSCAEEGWSGPVF